MQKFEKIKKALKNDNFIIKDTIYLKNNGSNIFGIRAEHKTAKNYNTGKPKQIFYVQGSHYQMGYMIGYLGAENIYDIASNFADEILFSFFFPGEDFDFLKPVGKELVNLIVNFIENEIKTATPEIYINEFNGLLDGVRDYFKRKNKNIDLERVKKGLYAINFTFDPLLAIIYTLDRSIAKLPAIFSKSFKNIEKNINRFKPPISCNGFVFKTNRFGGLTLVGRDMMFSTANVLQNNICYIIYDSSEKNSDNKEPQPILSITAPGFIGSFSVLNKSGVATGGDMAVTSACSPFKPTVPYLIISRYALTYNSTARDVINEIINLPRSVSWAQIIADPIDESGYILEITHYNDIDPYKSKNTDFLKYVPEELRNLNLLPDKKFLINHKTTNFYKGLMIRSTKYIYDPDYLNFNKKLWEYYNKTHFFKKPKKLYKNAFTKNGFINKTYLEKNCPETFYFPPQREISDQYVLVSNHFIIPEMALYSMNDWIGNLTSGFIDDIQWRYDYLNKKIIENLLIPLKKGKINEKEILEEKAKETINFLAPSPELPLYYADNKTPLSKDKTQLAVSGSITLFNCNDLTATTLSGYYCDHWVKINFKNYV